jgi:hypothetical protein
LSRAGREVNVTALPADIANARTQLVWRPSHHSAAFEAMKKLIAAAPQVRKAA